MIKEGGWQPELSFDLASRRAKANKIIHIVEQHSSLTGARILEIGTGGGIISSLLGEVAGADGEVVSVDVEDLRVVKEGYDFQLVEGTTLPFDDDRFDVVVSNHTMEHVGGPEDQLVHLREIGRTLHQNGLGYLASPSRWALVEPHFNVPLLSWLPPRARHRALRLSRQGKVYDISPRTRRELRDLIDRAGLLGEDITLDAVQATAAAESGLAARTAGKLPDGLLRMGQAALPTMVFLLRHRPAPEEAG